MPSVLKIKEISLRIDVFIFVRPASKMTPASSGRGEARIIPANRYVR